MVGLYRRRLGKLRSQNRNLQTAVDAMAEELDAAQRLCAALATHLEGIAPDYFDALDAEALALWDVVQPFGPADDDE